MTRAANLAGMAGEAVVSQARAQLQGEREELLEKLRDLGHGEGGSLTYDPNFADSSQVTAERGEAEVLAAKLQATLADVDHALSKIGNGSYGACESCGRPIPDARLEAQPAARLCIDCASKR